MALDPHYITGFELEMYFVDKTTGLPLAGGVVTFYEDNARTTPKLVYELSGAPPNYTYTPLPNPVILSSVGTIQDAAGNNIALYAYPYDALGNLQLYYVTVVSADGVPQFTREAWPNEAITSGGDVQIGSLGNTGNKLSNPQFAIVNFNPTLGDVITFAGAGTLAVPIAPDWTLNITSTGAGTVTVTRTSIAGSAAYPFNPPYTLTVTPGANVSALSLTQELFHNPDIWSPQPGGLNGWIASGILLAPGSSVTMQYAPSTGAAQTILTANNLTGVYTQFSNTVQLAPATNPDNADVGFVDINIILPTTAPTTLSNVQALGIQRNVLVVYDETPVDRQIANMFDYYNQLLQYKPIPSYLIGWDFALNPAQPLTSSCGPFNTGANTSNYTWDQTILFQTGNNNLSIARNANNQSLNVIAGASTDSFALIQYLGEDEVRNMLQNPLSVNVAGISGGFNCCISLWFTTAGSLPNMAANQSLVATLSPTGKPATFNGTWTEIPRSNLGDAIFTMGPTTNNEVIDHPFSGWNLNGAAGTNSATFFAIVVGCALIGANQSIDFHSISCVPGMIPTRPAPQSLTAVYNECKRFYQKSFEQGTVPATAVGIQTGDYTFPATHTGTTAFSISPQVILPVTMRSETPNMVIYNPLNNDNQVLNQTSTLSCTGSTIANLNSNGFYFDYTGPAGTALGDTMCAHWTMDARYGIV